MRSSAEIAADKNADKLEAMNKRRLQAFEDGLESLDSFDMERVEADVPLSKYRSDAQDDLKKLMAKLVVAKGTKAEE